MLRPLLYFVSGITLICLLGALTFTNEPGVIDLNNLYNYSEQEIPDYITKDNTPLDNEITDAGATLGRVLFYDKKLSVNNTIACASCHQQEFAFTDPLQASQGVNGVTGRHSMRLINERFGTERRMFWDERAASVEDQATMPIRDHAEMGFSGSMGDPDFDSLISKMEQIEYYPVLFDFAFGDTDITEDRMQRAIAQFVRSIQSFDSKYDEGRDIAQNDGMPFPNFSAAENAGKRIFIQPPVFNDDGIRIDGGAGCAGCHRPPEFDIDILSRNNGIVATIDGGTDFTNSRSPSLRDLLDENGSSPGGFFHNGIFKGPTGIRDVIDHYDSIPTFQMNQFLDPRLLPGGNPQRLRLTDNEKNNLELFMRTLTGQNVYTDIKWSDPFAENGDLEVIPITSPTSEATIPDDYFLIYPNPTSDFAYFGLPNGEFTVILYDVRGKRLLEKKVQDGGFINLSSFENGIYTLTVINKINGYKSTGRILKS